MVRTLPLRSCSCAACAQRRRRYRALRNWFWSRSAKSKLADDNTFYCRSGLGDCAERDIEEIYYEACRLGTPG